MTTRCKVGLSGRHELEREVVHDHVKQCSTSTAWRCLLEPLGSTSNGLACQTHGYRHGFLNETACMESNQHAYLSMGVFHFEPGDVPNNYGRQAIQGPGEGCFAGCITRMAGADARATKAAKIQGSETRPHTLEACICMLYLRT